MNLFSHCLLFCFYNKTLYLQKKQQIINIWRRDALCLQGNIKICFFPTTTFRKKISDPSRKMFISRNQTIPREKQQQKGQFDFPPPHCQKYPCFFRNERGTNALSSASAQLVHPPEQLQTSLLLLSSFLRGSRMSPGCLSSTGLDSTCHHTFRAMFARHITI